MLTPKPRYHCHFHTTKRKWINEFIWNIFNLITQCEITNRFVMAILSVYLFSNQDVYFTLCIAVIKL